MNVLVFRAHVFAVNRLSRNKPNLISSADSQRFNTMSHYRGPSSAANIIVVEFINWIHGYWFYAGTAETWCYLSTMTAVGRGLLS
jgi:hypothetical protein